MTKPVQITGLDHAETFPVGATLVRSSWHVAGLYGPGEPLATERDAIAAGLAHMEALVAAHAANPMNNGTTHPERFSVDLRWKMTWQQGDRDANGHVSYSSGSEFTIRRQTYDTLDEARAHIARIDKYMPVGQ